MSDTKISALTSATTPLSGTEVVPVVQSSTTKNVSIADLTAGRTDVQVGRLQATVSGYNVNPSYPQFGLYGTKGYVQAPSGGTFAVWDGATNDIAIFGSSNLTLPIGNLVIGTSGKGIDFSATSDASGMTSELLSDYEEGTWTPSQGAGLTVTGSFSSSGYYTKIGRLVHLTGKVSGSTSITCSAWGIATSIPFTCGTTTLSGTFYAGNSGVCAAAGTSLYMTSATTSSTDIQFTIVIQV